MVVHLENDKNLKLLVKLRESVQTKVNRVDKKLQNELSEF